MASGGGGKTTGGQSKQRMTDAEVKELEDMQGKLKNAGKTSNQKRPLLNDLRNNIEENELLVKDPAKAVAMSRPKNAKITQIVRPVGGAPGQQTESKRDSSDQDQQLQVLPIKVASLYSNGEQGGSAEASAAVKHETEDDQFLTGSNNTGDPASAILQSIYTNGVMVMQGVGSPVEDFMRQWDKKASEYRDRVARGEVNPSDSNPGDSKDAGPDAADGSAAQTSSSKKKRKGGAAASGQASSTNGGSASSATGKRNGANAANIPSNFSARYPLGSLPVYTSTAQPVEEVDKSKPTARNGQVLDHGTRFLEMRIPPHHSADSMFKWYLMSYIKSADERVFANLTAEAHQRMLAHEPVLVRWEDVQSYAFVEAKSEDNACVLGLGCFGRQLFHPAGSFTFQRWRDPDRRPYKRSSKEPKLCYADMLLFLNTRKDNDRATGKSSAGVESPFKYLIGIPGEYNLTAFRKCMDGNNEGCTRHIRHLITTQLKPSFIENRETRERLRRFEEKRTLQCRDGSKKIAQMQPIDPRSYESCEIERMTNERILFMFVFRDMVHRYKTSTRDAFPERLKICRLAFVPFEDALKMFSSKEFRQEYMPADMMSNPRYILEHFDLYERAAKRNPNIHRPVLEGYMVFWLLHIRLNVACYLLQEGLDNFVRSILKGGSAATATAAASTTTGQASEYVLPTPPTAEPYQLPHSAVVQPSSGYDRRAWVASPNFQETISNEIKGIREKLRTYVRAHAALTAHIERCMVEGEMYHDDALLPPASALGSNASTDRSTLTEEEQKTLDQWLSIKPASDYIGPFFPEDRGYIEYSVKPHVENNPGPGQLACYYLTRWCQATSSASQFVPHLSSSATGERVAWTTAEPLPLKSGPEDSSELVFNFPGREEGAPPMRIGLNLLLGDFRGLVHWMRTSAPPDFLASLYRSCICMETSGWLHTYHPLVREALRNNTWFKGADGTPKTSYVLLVTLQMVVYCVTTIMRALQKLYTSRVEKFGFHLFQLRNARHSVMASIITESKPSNIYDYATPSSDPTLSRERLVQLHESMEALKETIYQLHKFVNSHLPLACAMITNCSDEKGMGPTDEVLTDPKRGKVRSEAGESTASLYEIYYPYGFNVICEDNLPDCAALESYVKFISETSSSHKEPLLEGQQKVMPVRCHTRDHDKKMDRIVFFNPAYLRYCIQNFVCSALGAYRHCGYRTSFRTALQIYSHYHDLSKVDLDQMSAVLKKNKNISINVLRENTAFHIRNNPGFYNAVQMSFDRYHDFEKGWLQRCMDSFRAMLDQGKDLVTIDARIREQYGKNTPFVYRRIKTDFVKFIWNRLKEVSCKRIVQEFMKMDRFEWPDVLSMSKESIQYLICVVKELDPDDPDFDYGDTLVRLGCSDETVATIRAVESAFAAANEISSIESALDDIPEEEHILVFAFFHLLRARSSIKLLNLPAEDLVKQRIAVARRAGIDPSQPLPITSTLIAFCSIAGCNKRKTPVVQERGVKYFGLSDVSWDLRRNIPVCKPKKPPKANASAPAAKKRKKPAKNKKKGQDADHEDEDEEDEDHDHEPAVETDPDDENDVEYENVKSLPATIREFDERVDQIREKQKKVEDAVTVQDGEILIEGRTAAAVHADIQKLNEWAIKLELLRDNVYKAAKRDANRFVRRMFDIPCDESPLEVYPACGQVIERSFIKEKVDKESYTRCFSCGTATVFRMDMWYANGFTCGECDKKLREDLHKACCLGCNRLHTANKEPEKKKKRGAADKSRYDEVPVTQEDADRFAKDKKISTELYNKYKAAREFIAETEAKHKDAEKYPAGVSDELDLASKTVTEVEKLVGAYNNAQNNNTSAVKMVTAAADKRGSKRRKMDTVVKPTIKLSETVEDDRAIRAKRNNRSSKKLGNDYWYSYNLVNLATATKEKVSVCGICTLDRVSWLRELEPLCTVQEFTFLLRSRITTAEEAKRSLNLGHYADTPASLAPDRMNAVNKLLASVGIAPVVPKSSKTASGQDQVPSKMQLTSAQASIKKAFRSNLQRK